MLLAPLEDDPDVLEEDRLELRLVPEVGGPGGTVIRTRLIV